MSPVSFRDAGEPSFSLQRPLGLFKEREVGPPFGKKGQGTGELESEVGTEAEEGRQGQGSRFWRGWAHDWLPSGEEGGNGLGSGVALGWPDLEMQVWPKFMERPFASFFQNLLVLVSPGKAGQALTPSVQGSSLCYLESFFYTLTLGTLFPLMLAVLKSLVSYPLCFKGHKQHSLTSRAKAITMSSFSLSKWWVCSVLISSKDNFWDCFFWSSSHNYILLFSFLFFLLRFQIHRPT